MGCDIHMHVEIKIKGKWEHYLVPRIPRNYWFFAQLADVRNDGSIIPLFTPKQKLPTGVNAVTKLHYSEMEGDAHTLSWLSSKDFQKVIPLLEEVSKNRDGIAFEHDFFGYLFGNGWSTTYKDEWVKGLEDYRIIFWFDN